MKKKEDLLALQAFYRMTFENPAGAKVLAHLVSKAHIIDPIEIGDPIRSAFFEGQRYFVLSIMRFLEKDYSYLQKIIQEENDEI